MRLCISLISFSLLAITVSPGLAAEDLQGADAVLKLLVEKPKEKNATKSPKELFQKKLTSFQKQLEKMSDAEAATAWQNLLSESFKIGGYDAPTVPLPPPRTWNAISENLKNRERPKGKAGIRLQLEQILFAILQKDLDRSKEIIKEIMPELENLDRYEIQNMAQFLSSINKYLNSQSLDQKNQIQEFEKQLERLISTSSKREYDENLEIPDLVKMVGEEKTEKLLRQILVLEKVDLSFSRGKETTALTKKLALELVEELHQPYWSLVNSIDSVELYEAFEKKFVKPKPQGKTPDLKGDLSIDQLTRIVDRSDYSRFQFGESNGMNYEQSQAFGYYLIGLIHQGKNTKAREIILNTPDSNTRISYLVSSMRQARLLQSVFSFLDELLEEQPEVDLWSDYIALAVELNQTDAMIAKIKKAANNPELDDLQAAGLKNHLMNALLAADKIDEAYAIWKTVRTIVEKKSLSKEEIEFISNNLANTTWLQIGYLLNKPKVMREAEEQIYTISEILAKDSDSQRSYLRPNLTNQFITLLIAQKRYVEVEKVLLKQIAGVLNPESKNSYRSNLDSLFGQLIEIYHATDRHADILTLVDEVKVWSYVDVKSMSPDTAMHIATALAKTGKKKDAIRIVEHHLKHTAFAKDPMYALYVELHPNPIPLFDELYKRDQFEERPLIWKGHVLAEKGQLKEAEAIINQAISLDPSDGEQGKGNRMRVYAVLRDIKLKQKDAEQADFLEGVILAIRMSEHADDFARAGLLTRAITMYKASLNHFADAYCIQSRLAIKLNEEGKFEEAEKYYQKAYELMPDSFGRVESHCFGCEGVFSSSQAQGIAERVFSRLLKERPDKPQVHYLLGYLRVNQQRPADAMKLFERAVELDDNYINAWLKLLSLRSSVQIAPEKLNSIGLKLIELDPLNRNSSRSGLELINDFQSLWTVLEKSYALSWKSPDEVYVLKATKKQQEKLRQASGSSSDPYGGSYGYSSYSRYGQADVYPGEAMLQHPIIRQIYQGLRQ